MTVHQEPFFANMFMGKYKVAALSTGKEALQYLISNYDTIAIMLLKLELPFVDGKTLLKAMSAKGMLEKNACYRPFKYE